MDTLKQWWADLDSDKQTSFVAVVFCTVALIVIALIVSAE